MNKAAALAEATRRWGSKAFAQDLGSTRASTPEQRQAARKKHDQLKAALTPAEHNALAPEERKARQAELDTLFSESRSYRYQVGHSDAFIDMIMGSGDTWEMALQRADELVKGRKAETASTARDESRPATLDIHPLCLAMPGMLESELDALTADIDAHGLRDPITTYQGKILDGRHRYAACIKLGITPQTVEFKGSEIKAKALVISANVHRRHLTPEQKRSIIAAELKRDPVQSDRAIAKKAKVSPTSVGKQRSDLEAAGQLSTVDSSTGLDGKTRKRPDKPAAAPEAAGSEHELLEHDLSKSDQKKLERAIAKEIERLHEKMHLEFWKQLYAEVDKRMPEIQAEREKEIEEAREEKRHYEELITKIENTITHLITEDEWRFLIQMMHPDRAPDDRKDQYERAFVILRRLDGKWPKRTQRKARADA